jgi:hypothetical protein
MTRQRHSPERRAAQRNRNLVARAPLFAWAGLIDEWSAEKVIYHDLARAIDSYEKAIAWDRYLIACYTAYIAMLDAAITAENREEVVADMLSRPHLACDLLRQCDYLNSYLATYLNRTPVDIFNEARRNTQ